MSSQDSTFQNRLNAYKRAIDEAVAAYCEHASAQTLATHGPLAAEVHNTFLDILSRGGKRIRGALAIVGYRMAGGQDSKMIVQAALALEMLHAYILIIDDIQDRSSMRRGKSSAHEMLSGYHQNNHLKGDAAHAGLSLALNAAWTGSHAAQSILAGLDASAERRLTALKLVNEHIIVTAHGQTLDIMNELTDSVSMSRIGRVLEWKTAVYTVLNPLQTGMALAGAVPESMSAIAGYALPAGRAFQIADDILGVFGDEKKSGKSVMDDIREGKSTILTAYALRHANAESQAYLRRCLGDHRLTAKDFERCKAILGQCGALQHAYDQAEMYVGQAVEALSAESDRWDSENVAFLRTLAHALTKRSA